jgi:hypothetical protein
VSFKPTSAGDKSATLSITSDDPDENPVNVPLTGKGKGVAPDIAINPSLHNFGDVKVGENSDQIFTISNTGNADLDVNATTIGGANVGEFSIIDGGAFTVAPNATCDITVRFSPTSTGNKTATLVIASNDPDENPLIVALSGKSVEHEPEPDIEVDPASYDFKEVSIGTSVQRTFTIRNIGDGDLEIKSVTIEGTDKGAFFIESQNATAGPLKKNDSRNVTVSFNPKSAGNKTATLRFISNDPDENPLDVELKGTGAEPDIEVNPAIGNFGNVVPGGHSEVDFTVRNVGTGELQVNPVSISGGDAGQFSIVSGGLSSFTLKHNELRVVKVRFKATSAGNKSTTLVLSSNDRDENPLIIALNGAGTAGNPTITVNPVVHHLGNVNVGSQSAQVFTVSNTGNADLVIETIEILGRDNTAFAIDNAGPLTLVSGTNTNITAIYRPTIQTIPADDDTAYIRFQNNDPGANKNPFWVNLIGRATGISDISVNPTLYSFGSVNANATASKTFVVRNEGSARLDIQALQMIGTDNAHFVITSGAGGFNVPAPTAPDYLIQSNNIVVEFRPGAAPLTPKTATLRIPSNDSDENPVDIELKGNHGAPILYVVQPYYDANLSMYLEWTDLDAEYEIRRQVDGGAWGGWQNVGINNHYTDAAGIAAGPTYAYEVRAKIQGNWSPPSQPRSSRAIKVWPVTSSNDCAANESLNLINGFNQPIRAGGRFYLHEGNDIQGEDAVQAECVRH